MYYLQSRYYDPAIGRFINADSFATTDANSFLSCNMFAYCENNPVNREDPSGEFCLLLASAYASSFVIGGLVAGVISIASQYAIEGQVNWKSVAVDAVAGGISGVVSASPIGFWGSVAYGAGSGLISCYIEKKIKGENATAGELAASAFAGALGGALSGSGANAKKMISTYRNARHSIERAAHRANTKFATKQIAKYTAIKANVKSNASLSFARFVFGGLESVALKNRILSYGS